MKVFKYFLALGIVLFAANVFANEQAEDRGLWLGIRVGSPLYNSVMEADDATVKNQWGDQPFLLGVRRAEKDLNLKTGDYFQVNVDTGEIRQLDAFSPDHQIVKEFKATGWFLIDVAKDSVVVLPLDLIKDLKLSLWPSKTSEDKNLSDLQLLCKQFKNIADDLRTATGVDHPYGFGDSGATKIVLSVMKFSPSGVLEGSWDVVVGVAGAGEDLAITSLKIARRSVLSLVKGIKNLFKW